MLQGQKHNGPAWWRGIPIQLLAGAKRSGQHETNIRLLLRHRGARERTKSPILRASAPPSPSHPTGSKVKKQATSMMLCAMTRKKIHHHLQSNHRHTVYAPGRWDFPLCIWRSVGPQALGIELASAEPHHGPSPLWERGQDGTDAYSHGESNVENGGGIAAYGSCKNRELKNGFTVITRTYAMTVISKCVYQATDRQGTRSGPVAERM